MKQFLFVTVLLLSGVACSARNKACCHKDHGESHQSAEHKDKQANQMPSEEEMMKKWKEYSTPGEEHKVLNKLVGVWNAKTSWWMDPNKQPEISSGKSDIKWVMGGRFLEQNVSGVSMGQKFTGKGINGYDKATKKYRSVWYDSMGTGLMMGSGTYNSASKTIEEAGTASCPMKGSVGYRYVTTFIDDNHYKSEMYMSNPMAPNAGEYRAMLIEFTRAKK